MAKQVVTESHAFQHVKITLSYDFDPDLIGKKEREEVVKNNGNNKIIKYWISVPEHVPNTDSMKVLSQRERLQIKRKAKALRKRKIFNDLRAEKLERMNRYAEMVKRGELFEGTLIPTMKDRESARKLQNMCKRAQNKQLCKIG